MSTPSPLIAELLDALEALATYYRRLEREGDHYELRMRKCEAWGRARRAMAGARSYLAGKGGAP